MEIRRSFGHAKFGMLVRGPSATVKSMLEHTTLESRNEGQAGDVSGRVISLWIAFKAMSLGVSSYECLAFNEADAKVMMVGHLSYARHFT